ncbi:ABC transporter permease [Sutterella sp.]|uniref:cell division protein FtsX n=1 Tax=Sutterella sp. TaxID=1981025 RepID=UPI0026DF9DB2|nr:permease-like cell division protein FtsX [Sutterella sp.]MDO5530730.1 permease-like cell division protein FtsX [Sutterella sp.]
MSILTSRRWAFEETFRGLRREGSRNMVALFLAALALSIPLFIALVIFGLAEPLTSLPTSVELTVFTKEKTDMTKLAREVEAMPWVASTQIIPRDEALKDLNEKLGLPAAKDGSNPLPDILVVTLSTDAASAQIHATAKRIEALDTVDFVPFEASWHEKLQHVSRTAWTGLACLGALTAMLVILVLDTAIRMTTITARSEMRTLYLFGASPSFAIRPYAWRGFLLMAAAAALALGIAWCAILILEPSLNETAALYETSVTIALPPPAWCAGFIGASAFVGSLIAAVAASSAWRSIRRER